MMFEKNIWISIWFNCFIIHVYTYEWWLAQRLCIWYQSLGPQFFLAFESLVFAKNATYYMWIEIKYSLMTQYSYN